MGELLLKALGILCATVVSCVILFKNPRNEDIVFKVAIFELLAFCAIFLS